MPRIVKPQPGYQEKALSCEADIVFGGGSAGAGKTFTLLLEPIKGFFKAGFRGIVFRKTMTQIKGGGGIWDESVKLYQEIKGARGIEGGAKWIFNKTKDKKNNGELKFSHLEHEKDKYAHQGLQYAFIGFDELTHFSKTQFFYLLSRNRSTCGIKPYIRCTCNPDPESWVAQFIELYLYEDLYIIKNRDGVIRFFTIDKGNPVWGNTKQEVIDKCPHIFNALIELGEDVNLYIKSFTFIEGSLDENTELLKADPTYKANLIAQDEATKHALLHKCWKPIQDDLALVDYQCIDSITTNYLENENSEYSMSIDVAGFGKDLAVQYVWKGWEIIKIKIYTICDDETLKASIEDDRKNYKIPVHKVVYDNDGIGWALASKGYVAFHGGTPALKVDGKQENYKNLKTQCYYKSIEQIINNNLFKITTDNIYVDGIQQDYITIKLQKVSIIKLFKDDIKAIKRSKIDQEGRKQINSKEEQKNILGRSPDFGDTFMMKYLFELDKKKPLIII